MTRYTLILIGLFTYQSLFSQDISKLDSKYGMNKFKLESSMNLYRSKLEFYEGENPKFYEYLGDDVKSMFELNLGKIYLGYFEEKLYQISFTFEDNYFNKDVVVQKLESLFGDAIVGGRRTEEYGESKMVIEYSYVWDGEKTYLALEKTTFILRNGKVVEDLPVLWLISKDIRMKILNRDF